VEVAKCQTNTKETNNDPDVTHPVVLNINTASQSRVSNLSTAKGHILYCELIGGSHVEK